MNRGGSIASVASLGIGGNKDRHLFHDIIIMHQGIAVLRARPVEVSKPCLHARKDVDESVVQLLCHYRLIQLGKLCSYSIGGKRDSLLEQKYAFTHTKGDVAGTPAGHQGISGFRLYPLTNWKKIRCSIFPFS